MKSGIVSLYSGKDRGYLFGLAALGQSIKRYANHLPMRVIWESGSLRRYDVIKLQAIGWETVEVDPIRTKKCKYKAARWDCTFTKLHVFNQTDFSKVLFLDADCLLCSNEAGLLLDRKVDRMNACWVCRQTPDRFNSGVMLFEPSRDTYLELRSFAENAEPRENGAAGGDQSLLNIKFQNQWFQIADKYNQRHWNRHKPNVAIAHLRPHPWRGRKPLVHQVPYIELWKECLNECLGSGRARELVNRIQDRRMTGVEVGVLRGGTSQTLLTFCPNLTLHMVDTWGSVPYRDKRDKASKITDWDGIKASAKAVHEQFATRCHMHPVESKQAAKSFADGSLDFVFIDGQHDYQSVKADIKLWRPKIKKGGFISGHDYHRRWPGVVKAVRESFSKFSTGKDATWFAEIR